MKQTAVLVVSFGTTHVDTRKKTIGAVEQRIRELLPEANCYRAFTSSIVRRILWERDQERILDVAGAMRRAAEDGTRRLLCVSTHVMAGHEYEKLVREAKEGASLFDEVRITAPLLAEPEDFGLAAQAVMAELPRTGEEAVLFMGHGSDHREDAVYARLEEGFSAMGYENVLVATVEGERTLERAIWELKKRGCAQVILAPFMLVAGDHANHDMAGEEEDSWKSILEAEDFSVRCLLKGLGEYEGVRELFAKKAQRAIPLS